MLLRTLKVVTDKITGRILPDYLAHLFLEMVSNKVAVCELPKQTRSILLYWRLHEEWAEVLHGWMDI